MFDIAPTELLLVAVVALVVIGPKDLPRAMRFVGQWVAKARGVARHFRSGIDEMIRQSELEDMEKKWAAENERIMREHPPEAATNDGQMIPLGQASTEAAESSPPSDGPAGTDENKPEQKPAPLP
jgi:sec-independent protein translocase protein TatB